MYGIEIRRAALALHTEGWSIKAIHRKLGVNRSTIRVWLQDPQRALQASHSNCFACTDEPVASPESYAYLLGQYLGDGHLPESARVPVLRIFACTDYPAMLSEIMNAIRDVRGRMPGIARNANSGRCVTVQSYWKHWPCLIPQHGPGMKHQRTIELASWQLEIVKQHPWQLIRGLIHSDGSRVINTIRHPQKIYRYARYHFSNESSDIMRILTDALDVVGVHWTMCRPKELAVSRRPDVALMDEHIGPKT